MAQGVILGNRVRVLCVCAMLLFTAASPSSADTVVRFQTALGYFDVQLYDSVVSDTVQNFLNYVNDGDYANSFFHRKASLSGGVPFVLQGGGFTYDPNIGIESPWPKVPTDPPIALEYQVPNARGTIAMARTSVLDSATSQFYFNVNDNSTILNESNGGGYTVFGEVIGNGMDVVDLLAAQGVEDKSTYDSAFGTLPLYSGSDPWTSRLETFSIGYLPGDIDADGDVDTVDFDAWVANFPTASGADHAMGDIDGDGDVDAFDFAEWQANFAYSPPSEPLISSTPEPATLGLLLVGGLAMWRGKRLIGT